MLPCKCQISEEKFARLKEDHFKSSWLTQVRVLYNWSFTDCEEQDANICYFYSFLKSKLIFQVALAIILISIVLVGLCLVILIKLRGKGTREAFNWLAVRGIVKI